MATNFRVNGYDFDDLFDPYVSGPTSQNTELRVDGIDLSQRYAHLQFGQKRADIGYRLANGVDVTNLWAAKGTASYVIVGLDGKALYAQDRAATNQPNVSASVSVYLGQDGRWSVSGSTSRGAYGQSAPASGAWLAAGAGVADYEVMFQISDSGSNGHSVYNGAPGYASLTTGRSASLSLGSISAVNTTQREASFRVRIHLRRISTGAVSITTVSGAIGTSGWV